jgi:hypothetical protein
MVMWPDRGSRPQEVGHLGGYEGIQQPEQVPLNQGEG